jgi:hypothetical protein
MSVDNPYMVNLNPFAAPQSTFPLEAGYVSPQRNSQSERQSPPSRPIPPPVPAPVAGPTGMHELDDADLAITACANEFARHVSNLETRSLTQAGVQEAIARFGNSPEAVALDQAVDRLDGAAADAQKKLDDALGAVNTGDDSAAQQTRNSRVWDRERAGLEMAAKNGRLINAVTDLMQRAAPADLPVLKEELGPFLEQRKLPSNILDKLAAQRVPAVSDAQRQATITAKAALVMKANRDMVRKSIATTPSPEAFRRPQFIPKTAVR